MRDNNWLKNRLVMIWDNHFADIPKANDIHVHFGRRAKKRLGSTREENPKTNSSITRIKVNGHYKNFNVPDFVIDATLAHEICHYAHGFSSPLPQVYDHPHRGDVVDNEIRQRGLGTILSLQRKWLEKNWNNVVDHQVFDND